MPVKDIKNLRVSSNDPFNNLELPEHWGSIKVVHHYLKGVNGSRDINTFLIGISDIYDTFYYAMNVKNEYELFDYYVAVKFDENNKATLRLYSKHKVNKKGRSIYLTTFELLLNPDDNTVKVTLIYVNDYHTTVRTWYCPELEFKVEMFNECPPNKKELQREKMLADNYNATIVEDNDMVKTIEYTSKNPEKNNVIRRRIHKSKRTIEV